MSRIDGPRIPSLRTRAPKSPVSGAAELVGVAAGVGSAGSAGGAVLTEAPPPEAAFPSVLSSTTASSSRATAGLTTPLTLSLYLRSKRRTLPAVIGPNTPTTGVWKPAIVSHRWSVLTSPPVMPCSSTRLPNARDASAVAGTATTIAATKNAAAR